MPRYYYYKDIENPITGEVIRIKASDKYSLSLKIQKQYESWERARVREDKAEKKQLALEKTQAASENIKSISNILKATLSINDRIDWESLLDRSPYPADAPTKDRFSKNSLSKSFSFIPALKKRAEEQARNEELAFKKAMDEYKSHKAEWEANQKEHNTALARKKALYEKGAAEGVENYIDMVLDRSDYPDAINLSDELLYNSDTKALLVELDLPTSEGLPHVIAYKYVATKDDIEEKSMTNKAFASFYNDTLYQIILRTLHEVFESDYKEFITSVVLNGNTDIRDKATGKIQKKTIASIHVLREDFMAIDLNGVEPAACFRHFKGLTAGSLIDLSPVKPIMKLNRKDHRIIEAENILDEFDPTQNLATMAWEEFEVLIRDLFQKEFSGEGATVEVTRASRDAGVDAIAFDEDPIRGGKFVIQAKRYNNLVPLSAVRDLFGTVHNEGAVKGILVTTSQFGPDAVSFAKDKPLTLIDGAQLLYMLQRHGYDFKISLLKKRYGGDVKNPRGGVRHIIPGKGNY